MRFYLETSVHEPGHLKDIDQVQDIRVVMFHALKETFSYQLININIDICRETLIASFKQIWEVII